MATGRKGGVLFPAVVRFVQTGYGAHSTSYPMGTGAKAFHSPPSNAGVENKWIYTSTSPLCLQSVMLNELSTRITVM
jgi:hypothetical protein